VGLNPFAELRVLQTAARHHFGWQTPTAAHLFDLQPGNYYYRLSRTDPGSNGGSYEISSSLGATLADAAPMGASAEVPEPQGIALVLAALAALGWVSRRIPVGAPIDARPRSSRAARRGMTHSAR
jgi:hypothetical protein